MQPGHFTKGDQILFNSNRGGARDLYLMDVDGRNVRTLFGFSEAYRTHPAWSPAGKRIVYAQRALGGINIHTANPDGTDVELIVHVKNAHSGYPSWSSDGTEIAGCGLNAPTDVTEITSSKSQATRSGTR